MQKIKELLGLPVINLSTGKQIGEVKDVVIDMVSYRMVGVLLCHAGWFHGGTGIHIQQIKSIGADSITVVDETVILNEEEIVTDNHKLLNEDIIGKPIVTTDGKAIGTLSDIYVDTKAGMLTGYEVSDSVIKDLLEGRRTMSLPSMQMIGEETLIVSDVADNEQPVEEDITE